MDPKKQAEIARKLLKHILREKGVQLNQSFIRDLGNTAKAIDVPVEELKGFVRPLFQELLDDAFSAK